MPVVWTAALESLRVSPGALGPEVSTLTTVTIETLLPTLSVPVSVKR